MESLTRCTTWSTRARARGFTLIEILIALAIAAVLSATLVIVAIPNEAKRAQEEARRLAALLELAAAEARATGQILAWSPEPGGYAFWQRADDGEWRRFPESSIYHQRSFGGEIALRSVLVNARELPPGGRIAFSPYGSQPLIEATIVGGGARIILRGGILGRISLQREINDGRTGSELRLHAG